MKKKWNRFVTGTLVAALVFANSMTVFAYRDTYQREVSEGTSQEEIESRLQMEETAFLPAETGEEVEQDFQLLEVDEILYDRQFTDEEGNIYPIPDLVPYRGCDHVFVSGTIRDHGRTSDGGCVVKYYNGQRCEKCGYVIEGSLINTVTYAVCPH